MFELINAIKKYDPAAKSKIEIFFLYPGVKAIFFHRVSNLLLNLHVPFIPRLLSEFGRFLTGIEIHPGAKLGRRVIIDHGMGVVIGETAVVEDDVILYHGVTLGGTDTAKRKRHPTIESRVVIGSGAKILGNITVGHDSRIGSNAVVVENVPPGSTVVGIPGKIIKRAITPGRELCHQDIMEAFDASI